MVSLAALFTTAMASWLECFACMTQTGGLRFSARAPRLSSSLLNTIRAPDLNHRASPSKLTLDDESRLRSRTSLAVALAALAFVTLAAFQNSTTNAANDNRS